MFSHSVETSEIFFQEFDKAISSTRNTFSRAPSQFPSEANIPVVGM